MSIPRSQFPSNDFKPPTPPRTTSLPGSDTSHATVASSPLERSGSAKSYTSSAGSKRYMRDEPEEIGEGSERRGLNPRESKGRREYGAGLSYISVVSGDQAGLYQFVSPSITEVLGYESEDLVGTSVYETFHPDEIPHLAQVHYRALADDQSACVAYLRLLHKAGHYVECSVSYSTVQGQSLTLVTKMHEGSRGFQHAITAREVYEISPSSQGRFLIRRQNSQPPAISRSPSPPMTASSADLPFDSLPGPSSRTPKTFFILDRFTGTARIMYVSNDSIVNAAKLNDQSFYSIVKPSDRPGVRDLIESAKRSSPIADDYRGSGGHGYTSFSVLKIPDLPPASSPWPQGTDESERFLPGQKFIPVTAIFTASSDGVTCVIEMK